MLEQPHSNTTQTISARIRHPWPRRRAAAWLLDRVAAAFEARCICLVEFAQGRGLRLLLLLLLARRALGAAHDRSRCRAPSRVAIDDFSDDGTTGGSLGDALGDLSLLLR